MTDSLSAAAISQAGFSVPQAAAAAVGAGADLGLFGSAAAGTASVTSQVVDAEVTAVQQGRMTRRRLEDAVTRVLAAKGLVTCG